MKTTDVILNEKELTIIKRYPTEILISILFAAVIYLFYAHFELENKFRNYVINSFTENSLIINENSEIIRKNTEVLETILSKKIK